MYHYVYRTLFCASAYLSLSTALLGGPTEPCLGKSNESALAITSATQAYCVSSSGWSDTWFAANDPSSYTESRDVWSGEEGAFLRYLLGGAAGQGLELPTPSLDIATLDTTLNTTEVGSAWQMVMALDVWLGPVARKNLQ